MDASHKSDKWIGSQKPTISIPVWCFFWSFADRRAVQWKAVTMVISLGRLPHDLPSLPLATPFLYCVLRSPMNETPGDLASRLPRVHGRGRSIASCITTSASSRVAPVATQPGGRSGESCLNNCSFLFSRSRLKNLCDFLPFH